MAMSPVLYAQQMTLRIQTKRALRRLIYNHPLSYHEHFQKMKLESTVINQPEHMYWLVFVQVSEIQVIWKEGSPLRKCPHQIFPQASLCAHSSLLFCLLIDGGRATSLTSGARHGRYRSGPTDLFSLSLGRAGQNQLQNAVE